MKHFIYPLFIFLLTASHLTHAQSYIEGPDLPGTGTGPAFSVLAPAPTLSIQGTLNTPYDAQDRFQIVVPDGCAITGATYLITDTFSIGVSGFAQFGAGNQVTIPPLTGNFPSGPSGPFPVNGPATFDCMMVANIAANDTWYIVFFTNCSGCIDPDIPNLGPGQTICKGDLISMNVGSAILNDATNWMWYSDSCGGNFIGSGDTIITSPLASTTYYVRGEGGCVTPDACANIAITVSTVNTNVVQTGVTLNATNSLATYQWLDCNMNFAAIPGATQQTYTATASGDYAVQLINPDGCIDTSACNMVVVSGIEDLNNEWLSIYPNPVHDKLYITLHAEGSYTIKIRDVLGSAVVGDVKESNESTRELILDVSILKPGMYFLEILNETGYSGRKLIKL